MRRFSAIVFLAMGGCVLGMLASAQAAEAKKAASDAEIREQLGSPTELDCIETPLSELTEYLSEYHGIPVVVDKESLEEDSWGDVSIVINLRGISLRSALNVLTRDCALGWIIRDGQIVITTPEKTAKNLRRATYDVTDLADGEEKSTAALERILLQTIAPETWASRMEEGPSQDERQANLDKQEKMRGNGTLTAGKNGEPERTLLSIAQTETVHCRIERLLADLRALKAKTPVPKDLSAMEASHATIRKALASPTRFEFEETPLSEIVDYLKDYHSIEIDIDKQALDDLGVNCDTPITCNYHEISLDAALTNVLKPLGLTWIVLDEMLLVTTAEKAEESFVTVVYDVSDLLTEEEDAPDALEKLGDVIVATIAPTTWSQMGGSAGLDPFRASNKCALVIGQTEAAHEKVRTLMRDLRTVRKRQAPASSAANRSEVLPQVDPRVDAAMKKPVRWEFKETPLQDALEQVRKDVSIPVELDRKALKDMKWNLDGEEDKPQHASRYSLATPITLSIHDLPLQYAFTHLLGKCELIPGVHKDGLWITTPEAESESPETIVYDVADLLPQGEEDASSLDSLVSILVEVVAPTTWDPVGGPGSVEPFASGKLRVLVISQCRAIHRQCGTFLADLRTLKHNRAGASQATPPDDVFRRADKAVRAALGKPISVRFESIPLRQAIAQLEKASGANFVLNEFRGATISRGFGGDVSMKPIDWQQGVTANLEKVALRHALDTVLKETKLDWTVMDGAILVGGKEELEGMLSVRLYDLSDMPVFRDMTGRAVPDLMGLRGSVMAAVDETSWDYVGGPASCLPIRLGEIQALAIAQTERNHAEAAELLSGLRKARKRLTPEQLQSLPPLPRAGDTLDDDAQDDEPSSETEPPQEVGPDPLTDSVQWNEAAEGNTAFAVDLYKQLAAKEKGNVFFSPWSISTATAMAYTGARGDTAAEMAQAMHYTLPADELHPAMAALTAATNRDARLQRYTLRAANRLWAQQDWPLLEEFTGLLKKQYGAEVGRVDFAEPEEASREINAWAAKQTAGKIHAVIDAAAITPEMRLVLANAVYFKARWAVPFESANTNQLPFYAGSKVFSAPTMHLADTHRYAEIDGLQILEKPYKGKTLSMLILLPAKEPEALERLEKSFSVENLRRWTAKLASREVLLYLPRFQYEMSCDLASILSDMGMPQAFDPNGKADFSGASIDRKLHLDSVVHRAKIEVFERGTVAVAATMGMGGGMGGIMEEPPKPVIFRADHPFLYLIRDNRTGSILFMGRLSSPEEK